MTALSERVDQARPSDAELARIYKTMALITKTETETVGAVRAGRLNAAVYPVRGLEAVCAVMGSLVEPTDYLVSTYRNLGDAIAKGVSITEIIAEAYGRLGGTSRGMGGPMHLADVQTGLMATSGIVGGGVPVAVGLALAAQLDDEGQIAVTTFGDGATSIGAVHEAMNMAALWKLPIVFLCQNNQWGEHTALSEYAANPVLAQRAEAYGMRAEQVDGFDPIATWRVLRDVFDHARLGGGPVFVEALTYRLGPHSAASDFQYMPKADLDAAMRRDPTPTFRAWLLDNEVMTEQQLAGIDDAVAGEVSTAMQAAVDSPLPDSSNLLDNVYADKSVLPTRSAQWRNFQ